MKNSLRLRKHKRGGAATIKKQGENGKEEKSMQTTTALSWKDRQFFLNGKPFRILSGAIHYFRVVPDYWEDRLKKLKACGFNTVETCVCWNLHEPAEGQFVFEGIADLGRFIETARNLGLYVILRPGPYICTEWDFGGLPSWLLREKGIRLRCCDPVFLEKAGNYLRRLFAYLRPYFPENGGNVLAMQVENEYGSYGNDQQYLQALLRIFREAETGCLLFTSDGPTRQLLTGGSIRGLLSAVNFGSGPEGSFDLKESMNPDQPLFCCEYWNGWFDHWYEKHHTREADDTAEVLREILQRGASVNLYMFHGGTNFGFYNGANHEDGYQPDVTSYDYNSPLNENGDITPKYEAIRDVMRTFAKTEGREGPEREDYPAVCNLPRRAYGTVSLTNAARLFENLPAFSNPFLSEYPLTMEELGQDYGFLLYRTVLRGPFEEQELFIDGLHDRALIYLDGEFRGIKERSRRDDRIRIGLKAGQEAKLEILVENMGRINYGEHLKDEKGILGGVRLGRQFQFGWEMVPVDCRSFSGVMWKDTADISGSREKTISETAFFKAFPGYGPLMLRGSFHADVCEDCFVRPEGFEKGIILINGFHLGRYYNSAGPQKTLYLPGPLLKKGKNEILVLELEHCEKPELILTDTADLG